MRVEQVGVATVWYLPPAGLGMAGFGPLGTVGTVSRHARRRRLSVRALVVEGADGLATVFTFADLWSGTAWLADRVHALLRDDLPVRPNGVVVSATHIHSGPGHYAGNPMYDVGAAKLPGFNAAFAEQLAQEHARAVRLAWAERVAATAAWGLGRWAGAGRNRSLAAFLANAGGLPDGWTDPAGPGFGVPETADLADRAVDNRMPVLVLRDADGRLLGTVAWLGVHATALGPDQVEYHRDWPGLAVDRLEAALAGQWRIAGGRERPWAAIGISCAGDVGPLPARRPPGGWRAAQGIGLSMDVAERVEAVWRATVLDAPAGGALQVGIEHRIWRPGRPWYVGRGVVDGPEDVRRNHKPESQVDWSAVSDPNQQPKIPAFGALVHEWVRPFLWLPDAHPFTTVTLAGARFVTIPGEVTVVAAQRIHAALPAAEIQFVWACVNDYCGYLTTEAEYREQHYEGAHTLYGIDSLHDVEALLRAAPTAATAGASAPASRPSSWALWCLQRLDHLRRRAQRWWWG